MKLLMTLVFLVLLSAPINAQTDTLKNVQKTIEIFDVVAIHKEIRNARGEIRRHTSEMKGEILNYDQSTGTLTFKSIDGKLYSLSSTDYEYFEYNKEFVKKERIFVLKPRKENEFQLSVGIGASFLNFNDNFILDDYYLSSGGGVTDLPISIFVGVGKYFTRRHFVGVEGEIALSSYGSNYFSSGLNYQFQYDAHKRNVALYIPVGLNYFNSRYNQSFQLTDSVVEQLQANSDSYSGNESIDYKLSALSLSVGHGFSFIIKNKHSISLELSFIKFFPLQTKIISSQNQSPDIRMSGSGVRFGVFFNM